MIKIAVTGPESTGKSKLTRELAKFYNTVWCKEYSRDYLKKTDGLYTKEDIVEIAKEQYRRNMETSEKANKIFFADTEMIVLKVWYSFKYQQDNQWIDEHVKRQNFDLYLLCDIDLPWESDPLREHPNQRKEIFGLYKDLLDRYEFPYVIIKGFNKKRLKSAIEEIEKRILY